MTTKDRDETHDDRADASRSKARELWPSLIVAFECDRPLAGAARVPIHDVDRVLIGRGEKRSFERRFEEGVATLDVRIPGRSMSGTHVRIVRTGSDWAIDDLESRNGTFVNGARTQHAILQDGDVVEIGHTIILLRRALSTTPVSALDGERVTAAMPSTLSVEFEHRLSALARLATSMVPVLVLGESGAGKEVVARAVHACSGRSGAFVGVNCGAIPDSLVESQLFGHVRGAFSGAVRDEPGFVRSADGGTLFLDEIADLPRASQAALLRVLQEREVVPVGTTRALPVDVRFVAATHQPLASLVARGGFRHDLFARLAGHMITVPPLRDRKEDIGVLVARLLRRVLGARADSVTFTAEAGRALFAHDWPFNVRELEQSLAAASALAPDLRIDVSHLGAGVLGEVEGSDEPFDDPATPADDPVRLRLLEQLATHRGHIPSVAQAMGKARMQIHRWLKRYKIDPSAYRN